MILIINFHDQDYRQFVLRLRQCQKVKANFEFLRLLHAKSRNIMTRYQSSNPKLVIVKVLNDKRLLSIFSCKIRRT